MSDADVSDAELLDEGGESDEEDVPAAGAPESDADADASADAGTEDDGDLAEAPPRRRTALAISVVMVLLMAGLVAVLFKSESSGDRQADSPLLGEHTPVVEAETLDGGAFNIDDHRGQWVVVNFFATWCPPCVQEHPELAAFDEVHGPQGDAVLVSVIFDDNPAEVSDFFDRYGGDWPVVRDDEGQIAVDYGVAAVPETYLVDPEGIVRARLVGGVTRAGLEAAMTEIAAQAADGEAGA